MKIDRCNLFFYLVGGFGLAFLVGIVLCLFGCKQSPNDYTYPRRAVQAAQLSKWIERAGDPLCFTDYDMIVTSSPPGQVDVMLENARQAGAEEWADQVTICHKCCLRTVKPLCEAMREPGPHLYPRPADWIYKAAQYSPVHALEVAVYTNWHMFRDWLIRDQHGNAIPTYTADHVLTDWSHCCPHGLWDGVVRVGNREFSIGSTCGLTVYEWIAGPMRDAVILSERFKSTYDMICLDDDPFIGSPAWHVPNTTLYHLRSNALSENRTGRKVNRFREIAKQSRARTNVQLAEEMSRLPGSAVDWGAFDRELPEALNRAEQRAMPQFTTHSMVNIHHYNRACLPAVLAYHEEFIGGLNRKFIMLAQGPMLSARLDPSFAASAHEVFNGCILPSYGFGGYWPQGDILKGQKIWAALEEIYHPYGYGIHEKLDALQGDDVCYTECLVRRNWTAEKQQRLARESLAHTLVFGDAYFHCAYKDDESGIKYGRGEAELFTFPELEFELGKAISGCRKCFVHRPLYYRYFQKGKQQFTVVVNLHDDWFMGIPPREAKWFHGLWYKRHEGEVEFDES